MNCNQQVQATTTGGSNEGKDDEERLPERKQGINAEGADAAGGYIYVEGEKKSDKGANEKKSGDANEHARVVVALETNVDRRDGNEGKGGNDGGDVSHSAAENGDGDGNGDVNEDKEEEEEGDDESFEDEEGIFRVNSDDDDDDDGDENIGPAVFMGVHMHPPHAFLRQGDSDQELLEEMAEEKRARMADILAAQEAQSPDAGGGSGGDAGGGWGLRSSNHGKDAGAGAALANGNGNGNGNRTAGVDFVSVGDMSAAAASDGGALEEKNGGAAAVKSASAAPERMKKVVKLDIKKWDYKADII